MLPESLDFRAHQAARDGSYTVLAQLWEWVVLREPRNNPVGVSMTEHGAMEALSRALVAAGRPARGQVGQVTLVRPVQADAAYLREPPERTAEYDGSVILWR